MSRIIKGSRPCEELKPESELTPPGRIKAIWSPFSKRSCKTDIRYHTIQSFTEACYYPVSEGQVFNGNTRESVSTPLDPGTSLMWSLAVARSPAD